MDIAEIQRRIVHLVANADARKLWRVRLAEYDAACRQAYDTTTEPPAEDSEDWPDAWQPWTEGHGDSKSTTWRRRGLNDKLDQYVRDCREERSGWSLADALVAGGHPDPRPADDRERLLIAYAALTALHDQRADYTPLADEEWHFAPCDLKSLTATDRGRGMVCSWMSDVERDIASNATPGRGDEGDRLTDPMTCAEVVRRIGRAAGRSDALAKKMRRRGCKGAKIAGKWCFEREDFLRLFPKLADSEG